MIPLPPARKEWQCGEEWVDGEKVINPDNGCGQPIYQSDKRKFKSGKGMVLNAVTDLKKGGAKDEKHVCPARLDSKFDHTNRSVNWVLYHQKQMETGCGSCGETFNKYKNPLCPNCFKLECRKCGNIQQWIVLVEGKQTVCFLCGNEHLDVINVWNAYQRLYGKYEF